ncbi:hypothetical protein ACQY0O_001749 [Thecaphora frezii]
MSDPTYSAPGMPRTDTLGSISPPGAEAQLGRLAEEVGKLGINAPHALSTKLSIQSNSSSSSAASPTSRSYLSHDAAGTRGASAMSSRLATPAYYSGSSPSQAEGGSIDDLPASASFGGHSETMGGHGPRQSSHPSGAVRRGHAGHGSSVLAHKDSFGGLQGLPRNQTGSDYPSANSSPAWYASEVAHGDAARPQPSSRELADLVARNAERDRDAELRLGGGPAMPGADLGIQMDALFEAASRDEPARVASPALAPAEALESMGIAGSRGQPPRNPNSNGAQGIASTSSHHPARSASLSAAAIPSHSGANAIGGSPMSAASAGSRSEQPLSAAGGERGGAGSVGRGILRSQSLATDVSAAAAATSTRDRTNNHSMPPSSVETVAHIVANGSGPAGVPSTSVTAPTDRGQGPQQSTSPRAPTTDASPSAPKASLTTIATTSSSTAAAAGGGTSAESRDARQPAIAAAKPTSTLDSGSLQPKAARADSTSSRHGGASASEGKPSQGSSSHRSGRDRDRAITGASAASSSRHGTGSGHAHHSSSRAEASGPRSAKSSSRTLPRLPSAPNMKPAPPPAMYWSKAPVHGSVPRRSFRAHTANLCDEVLWLFGGCDNKGCFRDLWCFDTETMCWSKPKVTGEVPPARRAHSATMINQRLFVFAGGDGPNYFNDLYIFDTVSLRWSKPEVYGTPPSPRRAHTANYHDGQLIIFGGGNGVGALNDVHVLDVHDLSKLEWRKLECKGKIPIGRGYHTTNLVDSKLIVIGGSDGHMSFNDIHILRLDTRTWYQVKTDEIHNRLGHTATQVGSYLFVFGGHDSKTYTDELLTLNLVNLQWEPRRVCGSKPPGRGYHQAWLRDSRLFVHGGFDGKDIFDDLHYLDLAACAYLPQITSFTVELDDE